jgi:hypothetical protein
VGYGIADAEPLDYITTLLVAPNTFGIKNIVAVSETHV